MLVWRLLGAAVFAVLGGIPFAAVGLIVGWFTAAAQSRLVAVAACVGGPAGGLCSIWARSGDWFAFLHPWWWAGGAFGGALGAVFGIALWRFIRTGQIE